MLRFAVVGALLGACSGPTRRQGLPPPPPPDASVIVDAVPDAAPQPVVEADYQLPSATTPPVSECRPVRAKELRGFNRRTYDFMPITLRPLRHGPTMSERPYIGYDRTLDAARSVFATRSAEITACWSWASARGAPETTLAVDLTLDARGSTSGVVVTSAMPGDDDLIACVRDMLAPPNWGQPRARPTVVHAFLAFNNDMAPAAKLPKRPKAPKASKPRATVVCTSPVQDPDEIYLPVLVTSNFDPTRPEANGLVMPQRSACDRRNREVDKTAIRVGLRTQQGAFDACYADAIARTPALVGNAGAKLTFDSTGYARDVKVDGAGDTAFHRCMTTALEQLWVVPWWMENEIDVNLAFTLEPTRPTSADPSVLLEAGDYDAALAVWADVLRAPHLPYQGCLAHAGIYSAMTYVAPWLDDERITIAITNLARSALALPDNEARSCLADVERSLRNYVRAFADPTPPPDRTVMRHLPRYEAVLPLAGFFEWGAKVRWYHADYLLRTDRASEGEATLLELRDDPTIGAAVTKQLEERAKRPEMLHDHCPR